MLGAVPKIKRLPDTNSREEMIISELTFFRGHKAFPNVWMAVGVGGGEGGSFSFYKYALQCIFCKRVLRLQCEELFL